MEKSLDAASQQRLRDSSPKYAHETSEFRHIDRKNSDEWLVARKGPGDYGRRYALYMDKYVTIRSTAYPTRIGI